MNRLVLDRLALAAHPPLSAELDVGLYAVLEALPAVSAELVAVCASLVAPRSGRVTLNGKSPQQDPGTRAAIAALLAEETLLPARSVLDALGQTLALRAEHADARALLAGAQLSELCHEHPAELEPVAARSLALALALGCRTPALLALHEPLSTRLDPELVCRGLARAAETAVVLATVSRYEDARALGARVFTLHPHGWREITATRPGARALRVRCSDAEALRALLAARPEILQATRVGARELVVHGETLAALAESVAACAGEAELTIHGLREQIDPYILGGERFAERSSAQPEARTPNPTSVVPEHSRPIYGGGRPQ